jgi:hypothetical protein
LTAAALAAAALAAGFSSAEKTIAGKATAKIAAR